MLVSAERFVKGIWTRFAAYNPAFMRAPGKTLRTKMGAARRLASCFILFAEMILHHRTVHRRLARTTIPDRHFFDARAMASSSNESFKPNTSSRFLV